MQKLIYTALFIMGAFVVAATPASAKLLGEQSQQQKAEQEASIKCDPSERRITTNSYGVVSEEWKPGSCEGKLYQNLEQSQSQRILGYTDGGPKVHTPADTALDGNTMAMVIGLATVGSLSYVAKRKIA